MVKLIPKDVSTGSFEPMNHLVGSVSGVRLNEEVNVIGANRKGIDQLISQSCSSATS